MLSIKLWRGVPRPLIVFILCSICLGGVGVSATNGGGGNDISLKSDSIEDRGTLGMAAGILNHHQQEQQGSRQHHQKGQESSRGQRGQAMPVIQELEVEENTSRKAEDDSSSNSDIDNLSKVHNQPKVGKPTKSTTTTSLHQLPFCNRKKRDTEGHGKGTGKLGLDGLEEKVKVKTTGKVNPIIEIETGKYGENSTLEEVDEDEDQDDGLPLIKRPGDLNQKNGAFPDRQFLVATLDGKVTLLNQGGEQLWSIPTEELFSSTISKLQLSENGKWVNLIPSLTGGIYKFDGESLVPMLMNADSLLKRSLKHSNDVVISGGKEMRTYGVDVKTGSIRYECGISGCSSANKAELDVSVDDEERINLVITQQLQTVRAIDSMSGAEKWNFSVGTHELKLARVEEGCYEGEVIDGGVLDYVKVVIPEGRILGADSRNHAIWDKKFESPIAQAWVLENGRLIKVDPILNTPLKEEAPALYVGMHNHQFYVQESHATIDKLENALALANPTGTDSRKPKPLAIGWKPSSFMLDTRDETALSSIAPIAPTLRPFYVFEKDEISPPQVEENTTESPEVNVQTTYAPDNVDKDVEAFKYPEFEEDDGPIQIINHVIIASLWFWWKEVLGISLFTAVLLNILLMKPIIRAVRMQTIRDMFTFFNNWRNQEQEEQEGLALLPIQQNEVVEYPVSEDLSPPSRNRTVSHSSNHSQYVETPVQEFLYSSQYLREFDPVQCLGKGGFGVVFEAKKKIDDRNYAVKRIAMPNREKARDRVMREVKALAQLDHKNIVRYFNAWIEHPPNGWLEKNDPLWNVCSIGSPSPTYEYPSDLMSPSASTMNDKSLSHYLTLRKKPDHSKISFPNSPSIEECENPDSFIIFEASKNEDSLSGGDYLRSQKSESHVIPVPSFESTDSSVSGNGFWKRPTSLSIPSSSYRNNNSMSVMNCVKVENLCDDENVLEDSVEVGEEACENESSRVMYLYIQQELCQKRTLQDWLRAERDRDVASVVRFFAQIVEAVQYVHSKKLIHRDLKPSNVFLAGNLESEEQVVVKIGDFGLATTALAELEAEQKDANNGEQPLKANLTGHVGTHLYMSPEQFLRKPYDYKVDIYSLGLIFFELLVPFSTEMERHEILTRVRKLQFPPSFLESFSEEHKLIQEMISHNPNDRPDATAITGWVQCHLQKITVPLPNSSNPIIISENKTHRSQSSPAHMNVNGLNRKSFPEDIVSSPKRKFFKTHSTTTM